MAAIVVTRLRLRDPALLDEFFTDAVAAIEQAMKSEGNLGTDALADANNAWWSVTAWQERRLMQAYVDSEPHLGISTRLDHYCDEAMFVDWEQASRSASGRAEVGQHGQYSPMIVGAVGKVELAEDAVHVLFHRCLGDPDLPGDPSVRTAFGHQREDLPLAGAQHLKRIVAVPGANQVLHQRRVDHHAAVGDAPQRLGELRDVADSVFEQVTDPSPAGKQSHRVLGMHKGRQHHDAGLRELLADGQRRVEPFGGMTWWHPDVDNDEIRALRPDQGDEAACVPGLAGDLESRPFEQPRHALPQQDVVIGQDDTHRPAGTT
jgi:hypothetical protein